MSAAGLDELRARLLIARRLDQQDLRALDWEVGGFRDVAEQHVLDDIHRDVFDARLAVAPELRAELDAYVRRGPDGIGRRVWNAAKGSAIGLAALGAAAASVFLLEPSIPMYLVAQFLVAKGAPIAALGGAGFGAAWDN